MTSPREVLVNLCYENDETEKKTKKLIDQALSDLAEIVRKAKDLRISDADDAIDHIAKLFEAEQELCKCEPHFEMPQEIRCSRCHKILPKAKV